MVLFSSERSLRRSYGWPGAFTIQNQQHSEQVFLCRLNAYIWNEFFFNVNLGNNKMMPLHHSVSIHFMWVLSAVRAAGCPSAQRDCPAFKMS